MIRYVKGDLIKAALDGRVDVVVHGCNIFTTMGAGIAKQIKQTWPEAYEEDCKTIKGDRSKIGTITTFHDKKSNTTIVNAYTQFTYWDVNDMLDYDAIRSCMKIIKEKYSNKIIGMPQIGCGLAMGDWDKVTAILDDVFKDDHIVVYLWK